MYKVSELLGKPLISVSDAEITGTVSNIFFDDKLRQGLFVSVTDEDFNTRLIPLKSIVNSSHDAAVVRELKEYEPGEYLKGPINLFAFNQDGKELGVVRDVIMEGTETVELITDTGSYPTRSLLSRSDTLVIINDSGKPIALKKKKLKAEAEPQESVDYEPTPPELQRRSSPVSVPSRPQSAFSGRATGREGYDYKFLLHKRLQRSITDEDGVIVARENALVTEDIIERARRAGRLVQLALHSL